MRVKSLLELAYQNLKLTFTEIMKLPKYSLERLIYDKVVEKAKERIRRALRKNKMEIILQTIYSCRKDTVIKTCYKILGNLSNYQGSIWRIATFYAVCSYVLSKNYNETLLDVMSVVDMVLPYKHVYRNIVYHRLIEINSSENPDINMYINAYLGCGNYLLPYYCVID